MKKEKFIMLNKISNILHNIWLMGSAPIRLFKKAIVAMDYHLEFIWIYFKVMVFHEVRMNTGDMPESVWRRLVEAENIKIISGGGYKRLFLWNPPTTK